MNSILATSCFTLTCLHSEHSRVTAVQTRAECSLQRKSKVESGNCSIHSRLQLILHLLNKYFESCCSGADNPARGRLQAADDLQWTLSFEPAMRLRGLISCRVSPPLLTSDFANEILWQLIEQIFPDISLFSSPDLKESVAFPSFSLMI